MKSSPPAKVAPVQAFVDSGNAGLRMSSLRTLCRTIAEALIAGGVSTAVVAFSWPTLSHLARRISTALLEGRAHSDIDIGGLLVTLLAWLVTFAGVWCLCFAVLMFAMLRIRARTRRPN